MVYLVPPAKYGGDSLNPGSFSGYLLILGGSNLYGRDNGYSVSYQNVPYKILS